MKVGFEVLTAVSMKITHRAISVMPGKVAFLKTISMLKLLKECKCEVHQSCSIAARKKRKMNTITCDTGKFVKADISVAENEITAGCILPQYNSCNLKWDLQ
jgi:hypothetical protein